MCRIRVIDPLRLVSKNRLFVPNRLTIYTVTFIAGHESDIVSQIIKAVIEVKICGRIIIGKHPRMCT